MNTNNLRPLIQGILKETLGNDVYIPVPISARLKTGPDLMRLAPERIQRAMIFMAQNREGETFLWPVTLPVSEAHLAYRAMEEWVCFPLMQ